MKPPDIFNIVIKVAGFYMLLRGLESLLEGMLVSLSIRESSYSDKYWGVWGVVQIVAGLLFMRVKTPFVDWAFPEAAHTPPPERGEVAQAVEERHDGSQCSSCGAAMPVGARYCPDCGWKQQG